MMRKIWPVVLVLWLVSLACAISVPGSSPASSGAQALQSLDHGLTNLQSYRLTLKLRFTGRPIGSAADAASPEQTVIIEAQEEALRGSHDVRHFLFLANTSEEGTEGLPNLPGALEYYELEGQIYTLSSAQGSDPLCQEAGQGQPGGGQTSGAEILQAGTIFDLLPQIVVQSIANAQQVPPPNGEQGELINGVLSDHYRLDPTTGSDGQNQIESDVWVARTGGYVVRFTGSLQGPVAINILNGSGVLGWDYNLASINAVESIAVPEQCQVLSQARQSGPNGLPLPEDAQDVQQSSTGMSFNSPSTTADLLRFYQERLPQQGWRIDQEGGSNTTFSLNASREGQALQITISAGSTGLSQVSIEALTAGN